MKNINLIVAAAALALTIGHAEAGQIVNIDGTTSVGTTVNLAAGLYNVTYAGRAGGGLYDGYSLAMNGNTPVNFTDELSITFGSATNFSTSPTYDYIVGGSQQVYTTALSALSAYQNALATGTLSLSASYNPQNYVSTVSQINFTLNTAGAVTFTAPDQYIFGNPPNYSDNTGGVSILVSKIPEPGSIALLGAGLAGLVLLRRRARG